MVRPGMSDGRTFTSYESNCQMNMNLMKQLNSKDSNAYRKFLQDNAEIIMDLKNKLKELEV
jgi:hypothetical protein